MEYSAVEVVDDDRDEAYHSGLSSLQGEIYSSDNHKYGRVGKSPSPGTNNVVKVNVPKPTVLTSLYGGELSVKNSSGNKLCVNDSSQGPLKVMTPVTNLMGHFKGFQVTKDGQSESPTGEFDSGVFPSMSASAYNSTLSASFSPEEPLNSIPVKTPGHSSKELERMDVDMEGTDSGIASMPVSCTVVEADHTKTVSINSDLKSPLNLPAMKSQSDCLDKPESPVPTSLSLLQTQIRRRSESPCVPAVGESIEVFTDISQSAKTDGCLRSKRSAVDLNETDMWHHKKTPRLSEEMGADGVSGRKGGSQKSIKVSTIISPVASPRPHKRGGLSPNRSPRDSHSPVSICISESKSSSKETTPSLMRPPPSLSPSGSVSPSFNQQPSVNFKDIHELSQSSKPERSSMFLTLHPSLQAISKATGGGRLTPILLGVEDIARHGQAVSPDHVALKVSSRGGVFVDSKSPKRGNSPIPPATTTTVYAQLFASSLAQSINSKPISPAHSPSSAAEGDKETSDKKDSGSKGSGKKDEKPGAGNALLQVTEAHLATLSDEDGDTPLHLAIIHEKADLTQYLVKLIVGVYMNLDIANNMRQTPLHLAVITRQPHLVKVLVGAGASTNFPDRKGNTALHLAAARRDVRILQLLTHATNPLPDYNAKNFFGLTPIHVATKEASIDVLKFFFQIGANKNSPDSCSGRTALHYAVESENFTLVNFLLENNVNVNAITFSGNTPLHVAAGRRLKEIVALLMAYGANPAIANGEGDFPSDLPASLLMQRAKMHNSH